MKNLDLEDKQAILDGKKPHRLDMYPYEAEGWHWNRNFVWSTGTETLTEREEINPCRPPFDWRLLDPFEYIEKGDIYWCLDLRWEVSREKPIGTPYFYGFQWARKETYKN